jgi:uncharacterized protein YajQ (UPF0234 family)
MGKLARRNISLKNIDVEKLEISPTGKATQNLKVKQGLETETGKKITNAIRDSKLKVTTQIQDRKVRVTGKSRDDLQDVIGLLRKGDFGVALDFNNFRD